MAGKLPFFQKAAASPHGAVNYLCNYIVGHTCATLGRAKDYSSIELESYLCSD